MLKKLFSAMITVVALFVLSCPVIAADQIDEFVNRCYKVTFDREADSEGFAYWKETITSGKMDGSVVAYSFLFSPEYTGKKTSNEQYVTDLYMMFLGRDPDTEGYNFWVSQLKSGKNRKSVFAGFANSVEFYDLCCSYGITAGYFTDEFGLDRVNNVNLFVERLYKTCLGRIGDRDGQTFWVESLLLGNSTGISCAANFIRSAEYTSKGLNNVDYVKNLYPAFMGREADMDGLNYWVGLLSRRTTRDQVFEGFANSQEFSDICASYGIVRGDFAAFSRAEYGDHADLFDLNGVKVKTICYNADGSEAYAIYYVYANGIVTREEKCDMKDNLLDYSDLAYNSAGKLARSTHYNSYGNLLGWTTFEYDESGAIKTHKEYEPGGTVKSCEEFKNGKLDSFTTYNAQGQITSKLTYAYDASGNLSKKTMSYYSNGRLIRDEDTDASGNKTKTVFYGTDGKVTSSYTYEYYPDGTMSKKSQYDKDGKISIITEYDRAGRVQRKTVYTRSGESDHYTTDYDINGKAIRTTYYKADGTVIDRVTHN